MLYRMKLNYSYEECYKILQVSADIQWNALRKAYKKQIQKWHPDKFNEGSDQKSAADEKIKQINSAYSQLSKYYRDNGQLPDIQSKTQQAINKSNPDVATRRSFNVRRESTTNLKSKNYQKTKKTVNRKPVLTAIITIGIIIGLFYNLPDENNSNHQPVSMQDNRSSITVKPESDKTTSEYNLSSQDANVASYNNDNSQYFTYGSTLGEVILVQGQPSKMEKDTWFYGESRIYFYEGKVISWERVPGHPLKAKAYNSNSTNKK